jgi:hypothetical protein
MRRRPGARQSFRQFLLAALQAHHRVCQPNRVRNGLPAHAKAQPPGSAAFNRRRAPHFPRRPRTTAALLPLGGGQLLSGGADRAIRCWEPAWPERSYAVSGPVWPGGIIDAATNMLNSPAAQRRYQLRHSVGVPVVEEVVANGGGAAQVGGGARPGSGGRICFGAAVCPSAAKHNIKRVP